MTHLVGRPLQGLGSTCSELRVSGPSKLLVLFEEGCRDNSLSLMLQMLFCERIESLHHNAHSFSLPSPAFKPKHKQGTPDRDILLCLKPCSKMVVCVVQKATKSFPIPQLLSLGLEKVVQPHSLLCFLLLQKLGSCSLRL